MTAPPTARFDAHCERLLEIFHPSALGRQIRAGIRASGYDPGYLEDLADRGQIFDPRVYATAQGGGSAEGAAPAGGGPAYPESVHAALLAMGDEPQARKTPCRPRSGADCSLLSLHVNASASLHRLDQPNTFYR